MGDGFTKEGKMHSLKKLISTLCLMLTLSVSSAFAEVWTDEIQEVFDTSLDGKRISLGIGSNDFMCIAVFFDESRYELNMAGCDISEYDKLKKATFECKILMKKASTLQEYEKKNIYAQIVEKLKSLAPITILEEEHSMTDEFGFVKESLYISQSLYDEYHKLVSSEAESWESDTSSAKQLKVWSFTDEIQEFLNKQGYGYRATHPDMEIEYTFIPTDMFPSKLDPRLASGRDCPDVFSLEDSFIRKYVDSGLLLPLDDLYEEVKDKMEKYPIQIASSNDHVYAMSWLVTPGALFYRRSLAKKYFGTDDPEFVQKKLRNFDTFLATARELKKLSDGKCRIVSTTGDLFLPFKGARKKPWVVNDRLTIDPAMEKYMDMCRIFWDEELSVRGVSQWFEDWFAGMNGTLKDESGKRLEVFCYFLPTWGLHYVIKPNAPETSGDWAMCQGPSAWKWGGTWIAANAGTKNPKAAKELIRYLTTDDEFLESVVKETGDVVSNIKVQNRIKNTFSEPFLAGQNHYKKFCEYAKKVNGSLDQATDTEIETYWNEAVVSYTYAEKTKQEAIRDFKDQVSFIMGF